MIMSASRAPRNLVPAIGLCVRITSDGDAADGVIGWITHIARGAVRVDFDRHDLIARWFILEELVDERIAQIEQLTRLGTACLVSGTPVEMPCHSLEAVEFFTWEYLACRRSPALRT
jgi:hypothetical protein